MTYATGHYTVIYASGCILREGADKNSEKVGLAPKEAQVEVLETVTLEDGSVRGRVAATSSYPEGWLSLADRFVVWYVRVDSIVYLLEYIGSCPRFTLA